MQLILANDPIDLKILSQWHAAKNVIGCPRTTKYRRDTEKQNLSSYPSSYPSSYFAAVVHFYEYYK